MTIDLFVLTGGEGGGFNGVNFAAGPGGFRWSMAFIYVHATIIPVCAIFFKIFLNICHFSVKGSREGLQIEEYFKRRTRAVNKRQEKDFYRGVGKRFKRFREILGLSREDMAKELRTVFRILREIEGGEGDNHRDALYSSIYLLNGVFDMNINWLVAGSGWAFNTGREKTPPGYHTGHKKLGDQNTVAPGVDNDPGTAAPPASRPVIPVTKQENGKKRKKRIELKNPK